jgi:hypothetical protein
MPLTHKYNAELSSEAEGIASSNPRSQRALDTKVLRQAITSITSGALTYAIATFLSPDANGQVGGITLSVLIGGIALIVQLMVDYEHRIEELEKKQIFYLEDLEKKQDSHYNEIQSRIEESLAKMHKVTELLRAVEDPDPQTAAAMQLLRHATRITPGSVQLVSSFAHSQINQMSQLLKGLNEGESIFYDGEDRDWILGLTTHSKRTIDATSLSTVDAGVNSFDGGLWTGDLGQRYLELQRLAVDKREVRIRRIFIIFDSHGHATDEAFQRIYSQHKEQGIQTRVLEQSQISDEFKPFMYDFVVFDGVVSYEVTPAHLTNTRKPSIVKTQLILNCEQVRERAERFERLWESARAM